MRSRNVELILYLYAELQDKIQILEENNLTYAYILHNQDLDDNGELVKEHYHLRIFATNQRTISAWAKLLKVKDNQIQLLDNKRRAIRYLIHLDSPKKYQYSPLDVISNIVDIDYYFNIDTKDEDNQLELIFAYIDEISGYIYFKEVKSYVLANKLWSAYRRYYSIIKDVIIEHNRYCIDYMLKMC